jgi:hypothetical protein
MVFSNNMEYDDHSPEPIEGAFYATPSLDNAVFNYFREERPSELPPLLDLSPSDEDFILKDTNLLSIKHTPEYATNKDPDTPTNRLSTSLFSRERLAFLLRYGIAYIRADKGVEKHIMRYPQIFATKAIEDDLREGKRKGIIWHTQGSGKTALAYYNVKHLTDYYQKQGTIPKFYNTTTTPRSKTATPSASSARRLKPNISSNSKKPWNRSKSSRAKVTARSSMPKSASSSPCSITSSPISKKRASFKTTPRSEPWSSATPPSKPR